MSGYDSAQWFLVATIDRGIGQSWLVSCSDLSETDPDTVWEAAGSYDAARRWVKGHVGPGVRVYWETSGPRHFGYVASKHVQKTEYGV